VPFITSKYPKAGKVQAITKAVSVTLAAGLPVAVAIQSVRPGRPDVAGEPHIGLVAIERNGKQRGVLCWRVVEQPGPMEATSRARRFKKNNYTPLV